MTMEQRDHVGRAAARLLANGVDRGDRLDSLHLLGILDASADVTGRVRRPLDDLAAEFELDLSAVLRSLTHLEEAGAIERDAGALVIVDRDEGGAGGLLLSDFIDDVRAVLADPAPPATSRWRARAGAALVAAAAVLAVVTIPSTDPDPGPPPSVAIGPSADRVPVPRPTSSMIERRRTTTTVAAPGRDVPPTAVTPVPGAAPPIAPGTVVAAGCPEEQPIVVVAGTGLEVTNPSTHDLVVTGLEIDGSPFRAATFVVPARSTVTPPVVVPAAARGDAVLDWDWDDPMIGDRCG